MPSKQPRRRSKRCSINDGSGRCRRDGTGDPPICQRHRDQIGTPSPLGQMFDAVISGQRPSKATIEDAMFQMAEGLFGIKMSPQERARAAAAGEAAWRGRSSRPSSSPPRSGASSEPEPPPGPSPQELKRARATFGFLSSDTVTSELLKKRYRELARKWHPDLYVGNPAKHKIALERMTAINAAMDLLSKSV